MLTLRPWRSIKSDLFPHHMRPPTQLLTSQLGTNEKTHICVTPCARWTRCLCVWGGAERFPRRMWEAETAKWALARWRFALLTSAAPLAGSSGQPTNSLVLLVHFSRRQDNYQVCLQVSDEKRLFGELDLISCQCPAGVWHKHLTSAVIPLVTSEESSRTGDVPHSNKWLWTLTCFVHKSMNDSCIAGAAVCHRSQQGWSSVELYYFKS